MNEKVLPHSYLSEQNGWMGQQVSSLEMPGTERLQNANWNRQPLKEKIASLSAAEAASVAIFDVSIIRETAK